MLGDRCNKPWLIDNAVETAVPCGTPLTIFLPFPVCCRPLLHTKYKRCHGWCRQPSGLLSGKRDRLTMWAESPGKKEVELNVLRSAGWRGQGLSLGTGVPSS